MIEMTVHHFVLVYALIFYQLEFFYTNSTFNQLFFLQTYKMNALGAEIELIGKIIEALVVDFPFNQQLGILYHHK